MVQLLDKMTGVYTSEDLRMVHDERHKVQSEQSFRWGAPDLGEGGEGVNTVKVASYARKLRRWVKNARRDLAQTGRGWKQLKKLCQLRPIFKKASLASKMAERIALKEREQLLGKDPKESLIKKIEREDREKEEALFQGVTTSAEMRQTAEEGEGGGMGEHEDDLNVGFHQSTEAATRDALAKYSANVSLAKRGLNTRLTLQRKEAKVAIDVFDWMDTAPSREMLSLILDTYDRAVGLRKKQHASDAKAAKAAKAASRTTSNMENLNMENGDEHGNAVSNAECRRGSVNVSEEGKSHTSPRHPRQQRPPAKPTNNEEREVGEEDLFEAGEEIPPFPLWFAQRDAAKMFREEMEATSSKNINRRQNKRDRQQRRTSILDAIGPGSVPARAGGFKGNGGGTATTDLPTLQIHQIQERAVYEFIDMVWSDWTTPSSGEKGGSKGLDIMDLKSAVAAAAARARLERLAREKKQKEEARIQQEADAAAAAIQLEIDRAAAAEKQRALEEAAIAAAEAKELAWKKMRQEAKELEDAAAEKAASEEYDRKHKEEAEAEAVAFGTAKEKAKVDLSMELIAHVHVRCARGLAKADTFGKSDPYAIVFGLNGEEIGRTEVQKKTLDPDWVTGKFEIVLSKGTAMQTVAEVAAARGLEGGLNGGLEGDRNVTGGLLVRVEVHDYDQVGSDEFLGEATVDLMTLGGTQDEVEPSGGLECVLPLLPKHGSPMKAKENKYVQGTVSVTAQVIRRPRSTPPNSSSSSAGVDGVGGADGGAGTIGDREGDWSQTKIPAGEDGEGWGSDDTVARLFARIEVRGARGLAKADTFGKSDPYAMLMSSQPPSQSLSGETLVGVLVGKTEMIPKSLNPVWREGKFEVTLTKPPSSVYVSLLAAIDDGSGGSDGSGDEGGDEGDGNGTINDGNNVGSDMELVRSMLHWLFLNDRLPTLRVEVHDKDQVGDDEFLGEAAIDFMSLLGGGNSPPDSGGGEGGGEGGGGGEGVMVEHVLELQAKAGASKKGSKFVQGQVLVAVMLGIEHDAKKVQAKIGRRRRQREKAQQVRRMMR